MLWFPHMVLTCGLGLTHGSKSALFAEICQSARLFWVPTKVWAFCAWDEPSTFAGTVEWPILPIQYPGCAFACTREPGCSLSEFPEVSRSREVKDKIVQGCPRLKHVASMCRRWCMCPPDPFAFLPPRARPLPGRRRLGRPPLWDVMQHNAAQQLRRMKTWGSTDISNGCIHIHTDTTWYNPFRAAPNFRLSE